MPRAGEYTLDTLFANRPSSRRLFEMVERYIASLGPVKVEVAKTQVSFGVATKFAWVWLPQMWTSNRPEGSITLAFDADHRIEDSRIAAAVEPRPGRWTHHVVIKKASDLDDAVKRWLTDAYEFGKIDRRKRRRVDPAHRARNS